jgi:excisionase family DNA binding protein
MLPGDSHAIRTPARDPHATRTLAALLELLSHANGTRTAHLWLTLAEATDYSGLPESIVLQLVLTRKLPAMDVGRRRGGRWRIRRSDLERLEGQLLELPPAAV